MVHIKPKNVPFALSLLPFLGVGIALPVTLDDWFRGRLMHGDGVALLAGLIIVGAWESAILWSMKSKRRRGEERLLGRELSSWRWAPPVAFVAGIGCGVIILFS
jgi:hypothetical protein